jgi:hypothetical protein
MRPVTGHFDREGIAVECAECGRSKCPIGRDGGCYGGRCDWECDGYRRPPLVGSLWPGELASDFGFPVADVGTRVVWVAYPDTPGDIDWVVVTPPPASDS